MSLFAVTIETIGTIQEHTNADRLEMATLTGKDYEFVVGKGQFQMGDKVVYFPIDSLLPEWITDALNLTGKLSGTDKNRVKTIKLRGNISQGIVASTESFTGRVPTMADAQIGADVTEMLGVEKYDPPPINILHGTLLPLPPFVSKYDIESAQNYVELTQSLMDQPVYITEKLEGSHWSIAWRADAEADEDAVMVSQRNYRIESIDGKEHVWHKIAHEGNYPDKLHEIVAYWQAKTGENPQTITLRGEALGPGVQHNYYKLDDHSVHLFEAEINGVPLAAQDFLQLAEAHQLPTVPLLSIDVTLRDWLNGATLKQASDGRSKIADKAREGIVIKPLTEQRDAKLGRLVLKQRSPDYLAKSDF
ncbi:MAG: RNA ligase (ATP) [Aggregatilineales bacterium]